MKTILRYIFTIVIPIIFATLIFFNLPLVCGQEHEHSHSHSHGQENPSYKWSKQANEKYNKEFLENDYSHKQESTSDIQSNLWIEALGATLIISIAPYLILFFIPVSNTKEHEPYLKILLAFASGGLLGDAFLHLIPHALMSSSESDSHSHSHSHSEEAHSHDNTVGVSVLGGIIVFLIVEKFVRIFSANYSHGGKTQTNGTAKAESKKVKKSDSNISKKKDAPAAEPMKVAGYLNLAADFAHNLTDGLAIGASFMAGRSIGIVTTFTIFLHEIPHEIGDFAILLQSGCSRKKAMMLQLVTALGAFAGTCISLAAGGAGTETIGWILPFTAGGFIYIATVSVIPELLENSSLWQSVSEVIAILMGVCLMIGITWLE